MLQSPEYDDRICIVIVPQFEPDFDKAIEAPALP